jgi:tetratricopeptide (TPR) repeat protein
LLPIVGFDELMLQLQQQLGFRDLSSEIESRFKERLGAYRKQFETLLTEILAPGKDVAAEKAKEPVRQAAVAAVGRITKEKDWWAWELKVRQETDPAKKEALFRDGLKDFPDSPQLTGSFALFMHEVRKNYDEAERLYRKALELDPNNEFARKNYDLMKEKRKPR